MTRQDEVPTATRHQRDAFGTILVISGDEEEAIRVARTLGCARSHRFYSVQVAAIVPNNHRPNTTNSSIVWLHDVEAVRTFLTENRPSAIALRFGDSALCEVAFHADLPVIQLIFPPDGALNLHPIHSPVVTVIFGTSTSLESYRPTIRVPILKIDVKHLSVDPMRVQSYLKKQLTILTCALKFGSEIQKCIPERALFISNDLATGGAQRSLCNLVAGLSSRRHVALVTLIRPPVDSYVDLVADKLAPLSWDDRVSLSKKFRDILEYVSANRIGTLCFWNVDLRLKLAIGRFAQVFTNLRIIEVSPGPILNKALAKGADEAASMGITAAEYRDRVDAFVVKYPRAEAWEGWEHASALHCIPNGVPIFHDVRNTVGIGQENFRLVCSSRMIPAKFVLELLEGVALVRNNGVAASLTLIGGADSRYQDYWRAILTSANTPVLRGSVKFVGKVNDPRPFLRDADLAVMLSIDQGCPNASLEAMSEGVPVLANNNGGTSEQIIDGVTGFLITSPTAESVAAGILRAFRQFACLSGMGINARGHVREKFSMEAMCASYDKLIWGDTRLSK